MPCYSIFISCDGLLFHASLLMPCLWWRRLKKRLLFFLHTAAVLIYFGIIYKCVCTRRLFGRQRVRKLLFIIYKMAEMESEHCALHIAPAHNNRSCLFCLTHSEQSMPLPSMRMTLWNNSFGWKHREKEMKIFSRKSAHFLSFRACRRSTQTIDAGRATTAILRARNLCSNEWVFSNMHCHTKCSVHCEEALLMSRKPTHFVFYWVAPCNCKINESLEAISTDSCPAPSVPMK